jgi:integrase
MGARPSQIVGGNAHDPAAAHGRECVARVEACLSAERPRPRIPRARGRYRKPDPYIGRGWQPAQIAAGVVNADGRAKHPGLHSLRHFYASWCINRRLDGGLELPIKVVQSRLGHASIQMTADRYGHLLPRGDDSAELAAAERAFLVAHRRSSGAGDAFVVWPFRWPL